MTESPIPLPVSYSILLNPPNGELIAFSGEGHTPERYDRSRFSLGSEGRGSFTFPSGTSIDVNGSGTVSADGERVAFESERRNLSGVFSFARGHERGEVVLTHDRIHLRARAIKGGAIE